MSQSRAKQFWDLFIEAECGSYEKSSWCDIFLSQVLSDLHNGRQIQEIINFDNLGGIGTLIGYEILSTVRQVVRDNEKLEPLRTHLLTRGWRGFAVLHAMGQVNMSCSNELAKLLIYLYPICLNNQNSTSKVNSYLNLESSAVGDFSLPKPSTKIKHVASYSAMSPRVEFRRSISHSSARSRRTLFRDITVENASNVSSDEPDCAACALQPGGGLFKLDPMDFDYFTSVVRSDDETRLDSVLYEPPRRNSRVVPPHPRDLVDAATNTVMESAISPYEFCLLSVQLLIKLVATEQIFSDDDSFPTCTKCIECSLTNLCNLQFNKLSEMFNPEEAAELEVSWAQLLVQCLEKVTGCSDVTCRLIRAGALPMMLRDLEDIVTKINVDPKAKITSRLEDVGYGLICGSIGFLHSLLMQGLESQDTFLDMVNQTMDSGGGCLLEKTIMKLQCRSGKIIELWSQLIVFVKRQRLRKNEDLKQKLICDARHHYDGFGSVASSSLLTSSNNICCVYKMAMVLIRLLQNFDKLPSEITDLILRTMTVSGVCCCMPIEVAIRALIKIIKEGQAKTRSLCFTLLEKTIFPQLGACVVPGYQSTCKHCIHKETNGAAWEKLKLFRDVVNCSESRQSQSVTCHLIRSAPSLRVAAKRILLFKVFFPVWVESKENYWKEPSEHSKFIILACLSLFANDLSDSFVEQFISLKGTGHLMDLISVPDFSKHCCSVFEKLVISELCIRNDISQVSSLYMLRTVADMTTDAFLTMTGVERRFRAMGEKRGQKQDDKKDPTELLQYLAMFWRSFVCLTVTHATLRTYFAKEHILGHCQVLFNVTLGLFTKTHVHGSKTIEISDTADNCLAKLVECLLMFLLVTSPTDSDVNEKTMERLTKALQECDVAIVDVRKISEVLIKCCLDRPKSFIVNSPKLPVWSSGLEEVSENEPEGASTCSGEDDYVTADEGYDADVELKITNLCFGADASSTNGSESSSQEESSGDRTITTIIWPNLCKLVVEFLARAFAEQNRGTELNVEEAIIPILLRLNTMCLDNPSNAETLCRQSLIAELLKGFSPCLSDINSKFSNLRKVVLDLILTLGKSALTASELAEILRLFKTDNPPLNYLLRILTSLVCENGTRPDFSLKFPVPSPQDLDSSDGRSKKNLNQLHRRQGVVSSWSTSALQLALPAHWGWCPWLAGASLAFWVRIDRGSHRKVSIRPAEKTCRLRTPEPNRKVSRAESHISAFSTGLSDWGHSIDEDAGPSVKQLLIKKQLHFFSFGSENLIVECWFDVTSTAVHFRLTRVVPAGVYELVAEKTIDGAMLSATWHHVAVNISNFVQQKRTVIQVTWILDGYKEIEVQLPFVGVVNRNASDVTVLLGHQSMEKESKFSLSIANVTLFRTAIFTHVKAQALMGCGPNVTNLADCHVAKLFPNFAPYLTLGSVSSGVDWSSVLDDYKCGLRDLAESLLLVYSAHDPNTCAIYEGNSSSSGALHLFRASHQSNHCAAQLVPTIVFPKVFAPLTCKRNETIVPASALLGEPSLFLYLFARVVELDAKEEEQAVALFMLLRLVQSDTNLYSQFINYGHHKLLRLVFRSRRFKASLHMLKAIFDACCDKPVLADTADGLKIISNTSAIIKNSLLLSTLISIWFDTTTDCGLLQATFTSLHALLSDEHPGREFNLTQLNRGRTMHILLGFCKEQLVGERKASVEQTVWKSYVELVRSLIGCSSPEFSHIVELMDTLILIHPEDEMYINHMKNSFYLLLSAGQSYAAPASGSGHGAARLLRQVTAINLERRTQHFNSQERNDYPVAGNLSKALKNLQFKGVALDSGPCTKDDEDDIDSNRYSDDITFDSGISDTCREPVEQESNIVKAVDGSRQNLESFFPSISGNFEDKAELEASEKSSQDMCLKENCDYIVTEGFLLILKDVLSVLPDNMTRQVLNEVTQFEILLVMANHQHHAVRAAVVQLIAAYMKRANDDERNKFMKINGFFHLANQISKHTASQLLAEACLNLITPCAIALDDRKFIAEMQLKRTELAALPPLLALLPRSVHNCDLTRHLIGVLGTIFCKNAACAKALLDRGLIEVLVKALLASAHISQDSQDNVTSDLQSFLVMIAMQLLSTPGEISVVCNIRLELHYVGRVEQDSCKANAHCVKVIQDTQNQLLECCLNLLVEKILALQTDNRGHSAYITPGMTPEDIIFGPRSSSSSRSSISLNNYVPQPAVKELSQNELKDRIGVVISWCSQFLTYEAVVDGERLPLEQSILDFARRLFPKLLEMMSVILEKASSGPWKGARGILVAIRGILTLKTAELLVWLMCPRQALDTRLFAVTSLLSCGKAEQVIMSLLRCESQIENKFIVFLWDLMYNSKIGGDESRTCIDLKDNLQKWQILSPHAVGNIHDAWGFECNQLLIQMDKQKGSWLKEMESAVIKCVTNKYDSSLKTVENDATLMTRLAVDAQNSERKARFAEIRQAVSAEVTATARWRTLIDQLTHEGALWCDERGLPKFWQLDPTEGPNRIRNRLMPMRLDISPNFLKPEHQFKLEAAHHPTPLSYLFENHHETYPSHKSHQTQNSQNSSQIVINALHLNEKIKAMTPAHVVTPLHEVPGEILIGESSLYFVADDKLLGSTLDASSTAWPFEDVCEILPRRFQLKECAVELFLRTGRTFLIAFRTCDEKDTFIATLRNCDLPNLAPANSLAHYTDLWRAQQITNWEYLTRLNKIAGRSFNDLMQYPVFPFVLADYSSPILDLTNPKSYRNLKKPMAVQEKQNEQRYINNYNDILEGVVQPQLNREPYHYGSLYSNSATVLHFLVRLPPFTGIFINYQSGNFDLADRTFHNMATTWRLASRDSASDVKELIPEFYSFPEFLRNDQGFNLGVRQNGDRVDDVILPSWCAGDARRFVLILRQALENDAVTENLPHWIDLVFGYKQTGKAAVDAINVFPAPIYWGFDDASLQTPGDRAAWATMVQQYGQTPRQLFKSPHPLVTQPLTRPSSPMVAVLSTVVGLKWGNYVGSLTELKPKILWNQSSKDSTMTASLLPLSTNEVYALPAGTTCLAFSSKEKGFSLVSSTRYRVSLVSWRHPDGLLRVKMRKDQPAEPLLFIPHSNPVTTCNSVPNCSQLWIGQQSGSVSVVKFSFRPDRHQMAFEPLPIQLHAHNSAVTAIPLSAEFSIAVTTSRDGFLKIWDLNNISYVRSIDLGEPVILAAISSTLGDIAAVVQSQESAVYKLKLYSINAEHVGSVAVHDSPITAVCFSSAIEGISVNVVACGLANGNIRLFSAWNLAFVRDIVNPAFRFPIISLTYSRDSQHLYAGSNDGTVIVWENSGVKYDGHPPKFLNLKTFL